MRRAIVHIGMPRTGSTTIQTVLARLRPQLEASGILYPELIPASAAHAPHISHQYLGEVLDGRRPRREARELLDVLDAALARTQADTVVLSYEDLIQEKRAARIAATLRDAVARHGFRMEAVVTLKPQDEHLNSIYAHRVQMMNEKRLFASFARHFEHSARFAYAELLQPWLPACDGRLRAVPVRDQRSPGRPLLERFLTEIGLADRVLPLLAPEDTARRENRSPGPVAVEASRRLRLLRVPDRLRVPREMMRFLERGAASRGVDEIPFRGVGPDLRARLSARHATTNERFAAQAWGAPWSTVVAPEPERPVNELGGHPIPPATERTIKELMEEACREFGMTPSRRWCASPQELLSDAAEAIARTFRISRWRVV